MIHRNKVNVISINVKAAEITAVAQHYEIPSESFNETCLVYSY